MSTHNLNEAFQEWMFKLKLHLDDRRAVPSFITFIHCVMYNKDWTRIEENRQVVNYNGGCATSVCVSLTRPYIDCGSYVAEDTIEYGCKGKKGKRTFVKLLHSLGDVPAKKQSEEAHARDTITHTTLQRRDLWGCNRFWGVSKRLRRCTWAGTDISVILSLDCCGT